MIENSAPVTNEKQVPRKNVWLPIAFVFLGLFLLGTSDGTSGVLIPSLQTHFQIDKAAVGSVFICNTLGYLCAALTSSLIVRKLGNKWMLLLGCICVLCALVVLSSVPPLTIFACALLPLGFGFALLDTGGNMYLTSLTRNPTLLNYLHALYGFGAFAAPLIGSALLTRNVPWNSMYVIMGVICLLTLLGLWFSFRIAKATPAQAEAEEEHAADGLWVTLRNPLVLLVALFFFFYMGIEILVGSWSFSYLTQTRGVYELFAGWMTSGYWLGLAVGRMVLGHVAARYGELRTVLWCTLIVMVSALVYWLAPWNIVAALALCVLGLFLGPIFPTALSLITKIVAPAYAASTISFTISVACTGGACYLWLGGTLAQHFGLWSIIPFTALCAFLMLLVWFVFQKRLHAAQA